jgi:hypothetical protein
MYFVSVSCMHISMLRAIELLEYICHWSTTRSTMCVRSYSRPLQFISQQHVLPLSEGNKKICSPNAWHIFQISWFSPFLVLLDIGNNTKQISKIKSTYSVYRKSICSRWRPRWLPIPYVTTSHLEINLNHRFTLIINGIYIHYIYLLISRKQWLCIYVCTYVRILLQN